MTIESQCRSKETELTALDGIQIYSNEYDTASYLIDAISDYHQITSRPLINQVVIAPSSPKGQTDAPPQKPWATEKGILSRAVEESCTTGTMRKD